LWISIEAKELQSLVDYLSKNTTLQQLSLLPLYGYNWSDESLRPLFCAIKTKELTDLWLMEMGITDSVMDDLCKMVELLPKLKNLDLCENYISADGFEKLYNCLKEKKRKLKSLRTGCYDTKWYEDFRQIQLKLEEVFEMVDTLSY
jgi:hypothetical protein